MSEPNKPAGKWQCQRTGNCIDFDNGCYLWHEVPKGKEHQVVHGTISLGPWDSERQEWKGTWSEGKVRNKPVSIKWNQDKKSLHVNWKATRRAVRHEDYEPASECNCMR